MAWINKYGWALLVTLVVVTLYSCKISIGLKPISSIDYNKVKTISIEEFPNRAAYVYAPLATEFNQKLKDMYMQQTRLQLVKTNGDLQLSGEITGYTQTNEAVDASGYASKVRVTLTVQVNYVNKTNPKDNFENRQFSASQTYDATQLLTQVQDQLISLMVKDITEQIFNATVANW